MKSIQIGDKQVKFYHSIKELPMRVYNAMQGYLMQDAGIGSNMQAVAEHFNTLDTLMNAGRWEDAIKERSNLHYNLYMAAERIDFSSMAFACMIYSINEERLRDHSEENLKQIIANFGDDITFELVENTIEEVKKNFKRN